MILFEGEKVQNICFSALIAVDGDLYGVSMDPLEIWSVDQQNGNIKKLGRIPYKTVVKQEFQYVMAYERHLIFIPFMGTKILFYHLDERNTFCVDIELEEDKWSKAGNYVNAAVYQDILYLIPFGCRCMVQLDLKNFEQRIAVDFSGTILDKYEKLFGVFQFVDNNCIIMRCIESNHIVILNLDKEKYEIYSVGNSKTRYAVAIPYLDTIYLLAKNRFLLVKWDVSGGTTVEYVKFPPKIKLFNEKYTFDSDSVQIYGKYMYCFPGACNMAVKIDLESGEATEINGFEHIINDADLDKNISVFNICCRVDEKLYMQSSLGQIVCFDMESENVIFTSKLQTTVMNTLEEFLAFLCED